MTRSERSDSAEPLTKEEQLKKLEADYNGLRRMMTIGAVGVGILILGLILRQPGNWLVAVVILGLIEGISYPLLMRSLARRRDERVADLNSQQ